MICNGYLSCTESSITNVREFIAYGKDCLNGASITMNFDDNEMSIIDIFSKNEDTYDVVCNDCTIICHNTSNGCKEMQLYCFGECLIDCGSFDGCKFDVIEGSYALIGNYTEYPTGMTLTVESTNICLIYLNPIHNCILLFFCILVPIL